MRSSRNCSATHRASPTFRITTSHPQFLTHQDHCPALRVFFHFAESLLQLIHERLRHHVHWFVCHSDDRDTRAGIPLHSYIVFCGSEETDPSHFPAARTPAAGSANDHIFFLVRVALLVSDKRQPICLPYLLLLELVFIMFCSRKSCENGNAAAQTAGHPAVCSASER